ncbi:hypothetical protein BDK51DRAFT_34930 [Blyttiomyces helicus]|uniref:Uncharacterized protein n=1 Tax=Blyttiomyces helicus TaxID=388810 RepID=A0A4P9W470_9FUNG|nr:hypothetical protein BDK51DRAFT_34930 [Blyttiomyces helicus]|eukprot:RKO86073.1 hypothetical protein BDK51DRAFT_34930 [Blyttiomyces helicus]
MQGPLLSLSSPEVSGLATPLPGTSCNQVTFLDKLANNGKKAKQKALGDATEGWDNFRIQKLKKVPKKAAPKSKSDKSEEPPKKSFKWRDDYAVHLCTASQKHMKEFKDVPKMAGGWTKVLTTFLKDMQTFDEETQEYRDAVGKQRMIHIKSPPSEIHRDKVHIKRKLAAGADIGAAEDNAPEESADDTSSGAGGQEDSREDTDAVEEANVDSGDEIEIIENNEHLDLLQLARQSHSSSGLLSSPGPLPLSISIDGSLFAPSTFSTPAAITASQTVCLKKPLPIKLPTVTKAEPNREADKLKTMKKLPVSTDQAEPFVVRNGPVNIFAPLSQQKPKKTDSYKGPVDDDGSAADDTKLKCANTQQGVPPPPPPFNVKADSSKLPISCRLKVSSKVLQGNSQAPKISQESVVRAGYGFDGFGVSLVQSLGWVDPVASLPFCWL